MMKKLMPLALLFVSVSAFAGEFTVVKSKSPDTMINPGRATFTIHRPTFGDYPRGAYGQTKIKYIEWRRASYPASPDTTAELCFRPTPGREEICEDINSGTFGRVDKFNNMSFWYASDVIIRHKSEAGARNSRPVGMDSVTFHFTY